MVLTRCSADSADMDQAAISKRLGNKRLALAIITNYDPNGATEGMASMFMDDFLDIPDYALFISQQDFIERDSAGKIMDTIKCYSSIKKLDALVLAYHCNYNRIQVHPWQSIGRHNVRRLFHKHSDCFSKDAVLLLYSCSAGAGRNNIASKISDALDIDVAAPMFPFVPETGLLKSERVGEFSQDAEGRLCFNYYNFAKYDEIFFKGRMYNDAVATLAYHAYRGERARVGSENDGKRLFLDNRRSKVVLQKTF